MNAVQFPRSVSDITDAELWAAMHVPAERPGAALLREAIALGKAGRKARAFGRSGKQGRSQVFGLGPSR